MPGITQAGGFTITSPPAAAADRASPYLELAVQESPGNPPAAWLWGRESDILGQTLQVRVGGSFTFPPSRGLDGIRTVVFVAGGVGINPIMSMLSHVGQSRGKDLGEQVLWDPAVEFKVAYASRVGEGGVGEVLFLPRITELLQSGQVNGSLFLFLTGAGGGTEAESRPAAHVGYQLQNQRIASEDLRALVDDPKHCLVYICGPPTMTDGIESFLTSAEGLAMSPSHVITEKWW